MNGKDYKGSCFALHRFIFLLLLKLWVEFYVLVKNKNPHAKQLSNTHRDEDLNCILITLPRGLIPVALLLYVSFMDANN